MPSVSFYKNSCVAAYMSQKQLPTILYRTMMASAAGNGEGFRQEVIRKINKWKGEARMAAVR